MPTSTCYELLDFGRGRKLERFGEILLDRPSPAAEQAVVQSPALWNAAHARFDRSRGTGNWTQRRPLPAQWPIRVPVGSRSIQLQLKPTPFGHVGFFPEQTGNWAWLHENIAAPPSTVRVLNLFGYTGGATLTCAAAGAEVVHVDAAKNVVHWARHNAELSSLAQAPVRWIADDARRFVQRELRRGREYHGVILDPPTYGHGTQGESWKLERDLPPLLRDCLTLAAGARFFVLLTCHAPGFGPMRLRDLFTGCVNDRGAWKIELLDLQLATSDGRELQSGYGIRACRGGNQRDVGMP